ncbi:MAG: hypothetical protein QXJ62_05125 [Nitrososphaeria archaeon]
MSQRRLEEYNLKNAVKNFTRRTHLFYKEGKFLFPKSEQVSLEQLFSRIERYFPSKKPLVALPIEEKPFLQTLKEKYLQRKREIDAAKLSKEEYEKKIRELESAHELQKKEFKEGIKQLKESINAVLEFSSHLENLAKKAQEELKQKENRMLEEQRFAILSPGYVEHKKQIEAILESLQKTKDSIMKIKLRDLDKINKKIVHDALKQIDHAFLQTWTAFYHLHNLSQSVKSLAEVSEAYEMMKKLDVWKPFKYKSESGERIPDIYDLIGAGGCDYPNIYLIRPDMILFQHEKGHIKGAEKGVGGAGFLAETVAFLSEYEWQIERMKKIYETYEKLKREKNLPKDWEQIRKKIINYFMVNAKDIEDYLGRTQKKDPHDFAEFFAINLLKEGISSDEFLKHFENLKQKGEEERKLREDLWSFHNKLEELGTPENLKLLLDELKSLHSKFVESYKKHLEKEQR